MLIAAAIRPGPSRQVFRKEEEDEKGRSVRAEGTKDATFYEVPPTRPRGAIVLRGAMPPTPPRRDAPNAPAAR